MSAHKSKNADPDGLLAPDWMSEPSPSPAVDPDLMTMARASGLPDDQLADLASGHHSAAAELMIPYED